MQFASPADHYDRFMGRYLPTLASALADVAGVSSGMNVVDVGCGPGGLTHELAARVGATNVAAIDPASQFVAACRERNPGVDVREGVAESLPWPDAAFDASLSSLVVAFMKDPDKGVREVVRVTRPGGTVAACMWDTRGRGHDDAPLVLDRGEADRPGHPGGGAQGRHHRGPYRGAVPERGPRARCRRHARGEG